MDCTRIGLLTPNAELPGEYLDIAAESDERLLLWMVISEAPDSHEFADLVEMGNPATLARAARRLRQWGADVAVWACTSGSFVVGREGSLRQIEVLREIACCPATSTSLAFVCALKCLGLVTVSVLSPYPPEVTAAFERYLGEWGISVSKSMSLDHPSAASSRTITADLIRDAAIELGQADPLLVPDTAVWGFALLRELNDLVEHPMLVANQVTLWHAMQLAGVSTDVASLGVLRGRVAPAVDALGLPVST
jgi:maleate cis-trans isomerase